MFEILSRIKQSLAGRDVRQGVLQLLSFRVIYLCIFLPPVLYIFTLQGLERYLEHIWSQELRQDLIQNRHALNQGELRVQEEIRDNVQGFIDSRRATTLGAELQVRVKTGQDRVLYPYFDLERAFFEPREEASNPLLSQIQKSLMALENRRILEEGLVYNVSVQIPRKSLMANLILLFYIFSFALVLYFSYHSRVLASERAVWAQEQELESTRERLEKQRESLARAKEDQAEFQEQVEQLQNELRDADMRVRRTEEEALTELESLEQKLAAATSERLAREQEILELLQNLETLESDSRLQNKKQDKERKLYSRRFQTLYKDLYFQEQALEGFVQLPEELKLKAEEVIHNLNADPGLVRVKRKVFSQGATTVLETEFGHKGRIYWVRGSRDKTEILAIGTKNTQSRDLKYLERNH